MDKYIVVLTPEERKQLQALVSKGRHAAQQVASALILLNCDTSVHRGRRLSSQELAEVLHIGARKIDRVKRVFVEQGLEQTLNRRPSTRVYERVVDGDVEAHLIALSRSPPPAGRMRWSLRMLADKAVELHYVEAISYETIRRILIKANANPERLGRG